METLYRQVLEAGNEPAFKEAIKLCVREDPGNLLLSAWACRLDLQDRSHSVAGAESQSVNQSQTRRWWAAVSTSVVMGVLYALLARGKPPVPIPGEADPLFWIGWSPLTALGILFYLSMVDRSRRRFYGYAGLAVIPVAVVVAVIIWGRLDDITVLSALHLPFIGWAAIGAALTIARPYPARQCYSYLVKSTETLLAGGIYLAAGAIFMGLTYGIFAVLGINFPEDNLQTVAALGIGAIPVMAMASVYDPSAAPAEQDWATGLIRILKIVTKIILPLAIGVLAVYLFWFIPAYFRRPFDEREVLIVYNASIMAILVLLTVVVSGPFDELSGRRDNIFRYAVLVLLGLTLLLNVYALAAITSRAINLELTPNRYVVLGWNIVTLFMLAVVGFRQWRGRPDRWIFNFRESIARAAVLAVVWILWVLVTLPLLFN